MIIIGLIIPVLFRDSFLYIIGDTLTVFFYFLLPVLVGIWESLIVGISIPLSRFLLKLQMFKPVDLLFFIMLGNMSLIVVFSLLYNKGRWVGLIGILLGTLTRYLIISQSTVKLIKGYQIVYFDSIALFFATLLGGILAFITIPQLEKERKKGNELFR